MLIQHQQARVDAELDRLQAEGIITPIKYSDWAAAIVPVVKQDGSIRICGDYKLTVNRAVKLDTYPIPRLEDLFSTLSEGALFSKLDMSQAYNQLCLDEDSKAYTVINTHRGLFTYNRLSFGISTAPGIFQRAMEQLLRGLPGVFVYLDDILVTGKTPEEHSSHLYKVLQVLENQGLRLHPDKCTFNTSEVRYLGYNLNAQGINPDPNKLRAISDAPQPINVKQLQSFLGTLNFYRRFIPNAAKVLEPLNKLLRKGVAWQWSSKEENSFNDAKNLLTNSEALIHFNSKLPLVVIADSSAYGVGAVLCHKVEGKECPICFASRTLSASECNYCQLEKEALAIIFDLKKFHEYLWGQHFTIITDHKPLLGLFAPNKSIPLMASGRITRWGLNLQTCQFTLIHRSGACLGTADTLSRLPLPVDSGKIPVLGEWIMVVHFLESSPVTAGMVRNKSLTDLCLSRVIRYCERVWPASVNDSGLATYFYR